MPPESTEMAVTKPQRLGGNGLLWVNVALSCVTLVSTVLLFSAVQTKESPVAPAPTVDFNNTDIVAIAAAVNQQLSAIRAAEEQQLAADSARTLRSIADLQERATQIRGMNDPARIATSLREVETWEFSADDLPSVRDITNELLDVLRTAVIRRVAALQSAALEEEKAVDGRRLLAEAGDLLELHPGPRTPNDQASLDQLVEKQGELAGRLDSLQRLAYNRWAVDRISKGFQRIANHKSRNPFNDNEHLVKPLANLLAPIDPSHLEPAAHLLYSRLLALAQEDLGKDQHRQLTQLLVAPDQIRETPEIF